MIRFLMWSEWFASFIPLIFISSGVGIILFASNCGLFMALSYLDEKESKA